MSASLALSLSNFVLSVANTQIMSQKATHEYIREYLKTLNDDLGAVFKQISFTSDELGRQHLQRKIDHLVEEINRLEEKLYSLPSKSTIQGSKEQIQQWNLHFPKINFKEVIKIINLLNDSFTEKRHGAALFLLQHTKLMAGNLCIERIKNDLAGTTGDFQHYAIAFSSCDRMDEITMLRKLDEHINPMQQKNKNEVVEQIQIEEYNTAVVERLIGSLHTGSVRLLELKAWNISEDTNFLHWFVHEFWASITSSLLTLSDYPDIRIFAIINVKTDVSRNWLNMDFYCKLENYDAKKIIELPLEHWTEDEIYRWLVRYSSVGLSNQALKMITKNIFKASNKGIPHLAYDAMKEILQDYVT